jgi:hypothetical protein
MFRCQRRSPQPVYLRNAEGIRFLDEHPATPVPPKAEAKAAVPPATPPKRREWPIGILAFLAVVGTGLVAKHTGFVGASNVRVEDELNRSFEVSNTPQLVVDAFNGPIEVSRGGSGRVECTVVKQASGEDDVHAREALKKIAVAITQDGDKVRVTARRSGLAWGLGKSVRVRVPDGTAVTLRTENGAINVTATEGTVDARCTNGHIKVQGATGAIALAATNAAISCEASDAVVRVETTNGPVEFRGTLAPGHSSLQSTNGRVTVKLPESQSFRLDARTTNGKIQSDFDLNREHRSKSKLLVGFVGSDPKAELKVRTTNGGIRIVEED